MIRALTPRNGPQPDTPTPPSPAPPGVPTPDQKPEVGPMGEPPGVPSPTPAPQRDDDLPHTIDPLGMRRGRARLPVPATLRRSPARSPRAACCAG
jgi:hypothetical protein